MNMPGKDEVVPATPEKLTTTLNDVLTGISKSDLEDLEKGKASYKVSAAVGLTSSKGPSTLMISNIMPQAGSSCTIFITKPIGLYGSHMLKFLKKKLHIDEDKKLISEGVDNLIESTQLSCEAFYLEKLKQPPLSDTKATSTEDAKNDRPLLMMFELKFENQEKVDKLKKELNAVEDKQAEALTLKREAGKDDAKPSDIINGVNNIITTKPPESTIDLSGVKKPEATMKIEELKDCINELTKKLDEMKKTKSKDYEDEMKKGILGEIFDDAEISMFFDVKSVSARVFRCKQGDFSRLEEYAKVLKA
jgi:hypothetical protein